MKAEQLYEIIVESADGERIRFQWRVKLEDYDWNEDGTLTVKIGDEDYWVVSPHNHDIRIRKMPL